MKLNTLNNYTFTAEYFNATAVDGVPTISGKVPVTYTYEYGGVVDCSVTSRGEVGNLILVCDQAFPVATQFQSITDRTGVSIFGGSAYNVSYMTPLIDAMGYVYAYSHLLKVA
jgi:hypothetical protein